MMQLNDAEKRQMTVSYAQFRQEQLYAGAQLSGN